MDAWEITKTDNNGYILKIITFNAVGKSKEYIFVFSDKSKLLNHLAKSDLN